MEEYLTLQNLLILAGGIFLQYKFKVFEWVKEKLS